MSTGMELIPLALAIGAAATAWNRLSEHRDVGQTTDRTLRQLPTRFRDEALVLEALGDGAVERDGTLHGVVAGVPLALTTNDEGTYVAHFHGDLPAAEAVAVVRTLDEIYGGLVQRDVRERVLARAPAHGLTFEHETVDDDGSIVLTLQVGA
jgi:hypothetical protein